MTSSTKCYSVFLSHSPADQPAVADLARRLADAGLHPWFAAAHLIPGEPWQEAMEVTLRTLACTLRWGASWIRRCSWVRNPSPRRIAPSALKRFAGRDGVGGVATELLHRFT